MGVPIETEPYHETPPSNDDNSIVHLENEKKNVRLLSIL